MPDTYIRVTERELPGMQEALVQGVAAALDVPYGRDGYTGMAGRRPDGTLQRAGRGESRRYAEPRELLDGDWAIPVDLGRLDRDWNSDRTFRVAIDLADVVVETIPEEDFVPQESDDIGLAS